MGYELNSTDILKLRPKLRSIQSIRCPHAQIVESSGVLAVTLLLF